MGRLRRVGGEGMAAPLYCKAFGGGERRHTGQVVRRSRLRAAPRARGVHPPAALSAREGSLAMQPMAVLPICFPLQRYVIHGTKFSNKT
jgi:hypothetical protein